MKARLLRSFVSWLPLAVAITLLFALVYGAVQQELRQSANDPQIQISEDAASALAGGQSLAVVPPPRVVVATSLAPFVIVYDDGGNVIATSAVLVGQQPNVPPGVFDYTRRHHQDRFTWQPQPGVRIASVLTRYADESSGFVLAGRSLREIEDRKSRIGNLIVAGWLMTMAASLAATVLVAAIGSRVGWAH